ncbi:MAG: Ig-like domain-containing protein [Ruminiclostridium sp.]
MKRLKCFLTLVLAAVMMMSMFTVTVAADGFDDAKKITSGKSVEGKMSDYGYNYYKITCKSSGTLTIDFTTKIRATYWYLYDEDGGAIPLESFSIKSGNDLGARKGNTNIRVVEDGTAKKAAGKLSYKVKKGTYYIAVRNDNPYGGETYKFTADFKADNAKELSYLGITMKKGGTMQLEAVGADSGKTAWTTSKKSVATVSASGLVTAKEKGTAVITCKSGDVSVKLKITVK